MQFLIGHHAKLAVNLDKLEGKTQRIADRMIVVTSVLGQLITEQRATNQRVDRLHEVFMQHLRRDHGFTDI